MAVYNVHERLLPVEQAEVASLVDGLASDNDWLWPHGLWPAIRFDRPLGVGAVGGHGPIGYTVHAYVAGCWARFTFTAPRGLHGFHEFTVHTAEGGGTLLRHTMVMRTRGLARFTWPVIFRPLHDALLEDSLDRAERVLTATVVRPSCWSRYVRLLRWLATRRERNW